MFRKRLFLVALFLALVLFSISHKPKEEKFSTAPPVLAPLAYVVKLGYCPEATMCVLNILGEPSLLGKQVAVLVGSYQAPSAHHYGCSLEQFRGEKAAKYLEETIRNANLAVLTNPHKTKGSPYLRGTLMLDGQDVTVLMFELNLAVPKGIKVDWCAKVSRGLEV